MLFNKVKNIFKKKKTCGIPPMVDKRTSLYSVEGAELSKDQLEADTPLVPVLTEGGKVLFVAEHECPEITKWAAENFGPGNPVDCFLIRMVGNKYSNWAETVSGEEAEEDIVATTSPVVPAPAAVTITPIHEVARVVDEDLTLGSIVDRYRIDHNNSEFFSELPYLYSEFDLPSLSPPSSPTLSDISSEGPLTPP